MNSSSRQASFLATLLAPFQTARGLSIRLILLFIFINGLVLFNALLHAPEANYDGVEHFRYIEALAQQNRLPNLEDSKEYFSPPLPYLLPAAILQNFTASLWAAAKIGQFLNVVLSLIVTYTLIKICDLLSAQDENLKLSTLGILGLLPVYYKTFALIRGEPFVTLFATLSVYLTLILFARDLIPGQPPLPNSRRVLHLVGLGICLGLAVLSRQWAFFLFPALALFVGLLLLKAHGAQRKIMLGSLIASFVIAFAVGGWFYLSLLARYGTVTAFNRNPHARFSFSNQPPEFYTGLGFPELFTDPIRNAFPNQFIPIFYTETWGDYWGYFIVAGRDTRTNELLVGSYQQPQWAKERPPAWFVTNKFEVTPYLGRVNIVSLLPTGIMLAGMILGLIHLVRFMGQIPHPLPVGNTLFTLIIFLTLAGYAWFLIRYPNPDKGDTIKASYMLHLYPFLALLSGQVLQRIKIASPIAGRILVFLLFAVLLHNLPAMITHYIPWDRLVYYSTFRWLAAYLPWH